jgi:hypothetical protein
MKIAVALGDQGSSSFLLQTERIDPLIVFAALSQHRVNG